MCGTCETNALMKVGEEDRAGAAREVGRGGREEGFDEAERGGDEDAFGVESMAGARVPAHTAHTARQQERERLRRE